jgi:hypothetical protein
MDSNDVARSFQRFLTDYELFRKNNGLTDVIENPYEIIAGMTDKLGRIVRQVKHKERNDEKPNWPEGATEAIWGLLAYTIMLKDHYDFDVSEGIRNELQSAVEQYGGKNTTVKTVKEAVEEEKGDLATIIIKSKKEDNDE